MDKLPRLHLSPRFYSGGFNTYRLEFRWSRIWGLRMSLEWSIRGRARTLQLRFPEP